MNCQIIDQPYSYSTVPYVVGVDYIDDEISLRARLDISP